jgi:hypothetical protein
MNHSFLFLFHARSKDRREMYNSNLPASSSQSGCEFARMLQRLLLAGKAYRNIRTMWQVESEK